MSPALDGLFWFGSQRIAADVLRLEKIRDADEITEQTMVSDNLTATVRNVPFYAPAQG